MVFNRKSLVLVLITTLLAGNVWASTYRLVLQSGHEDLPVALQWHENSSTVVSVGEDGRLIVTDPQKGSVLHRFRITDELVHDMALDPSSDKAAIVTRRGEGFAVSVWDWGDEEMKFDYELESEPLFLSWSARGRYLIVGNLGNPTIIVLEGRTGRRLSYLQRLPSLYNAGYIGSTESILMTYASSGSIRYWDIRSSALKLSAETVTSLEQPTVLQVGSKSSMFGYRNETLYLVNRQTGAVQDRIDIPGLVDVSIDPYTGDVEALSSNLAGSQLHRFNTSIEQFVPRDPYVPEEAPDEDDEEDLPEYQPKQLNPELKPVKVLRRGETTYLMNEEGDLISDSGEFFAPVIDDRVWRPDSLAFSGDSLYLSNGGMVQRFISAFFSAESKGSMDSLNGLAREELNLFTRAEDSGLVGLGSGRLLHWDRGGSGTGNGYRTFAFNAGEAEFTSVSGSLQSLELVDDERILTVDRNGAIALRSLESSEVFGTYSALGILDAAFDLEENVALIGRSSSGRTGTPMEEVDLRTGESIPITDSRFMVYKMMAADDGIYSVGIERSSGSSKTVVLLHEPGNPEKTRKIFSMTGEHLDADLVPDPGGRGVFISLGGEVLRIDGSRKTEYEWDEPVLKLGFSGSVLYGIDVDGALVFWNGRSGDAMLRVYFFNDGGWIALPPDSRTIWASPGAIENVVLYRDGRPVDPRRVSFSTIRSVEAGS